MSIMTNDPSNRVTKLSPVKVQLLAQRLKERKGEGSSPQPIPRQIASRVIAPLSFGQERLWLLDQLEAGDAAFNVQHDKRIPGALTYPVLEQTFNEVVRRHEVLRTTFRLEQEKPAQFVSPVESKVIPIVDLSGLAPEELRNETTLLSETELSRRIDIEKEWSIRPTLLRRYNQESIFLMTVHHIAFDAWSWKILDEEMRAICIDFSEGKPSAVAEPPIQYADYAVWQRQWLQGEILEAQLSYWKQQMSSLPPILEVPTDKPRAERQIYLSAFQSMAFSRTLSRGLILLSHREGSSLFMTLLAAFKVLLLHLTGQQDISIGTVISNRNQSQLEKVIGFFLNTLILRTDLSGKPTFRELIRRVRQVTLGAHANADIPFENILEAIQPVRDSGLAKLFRITFGLNTLSRSSVMWLPGPENREYVLNKEWDDNDLALNIQNAGNEIAATIRYNSKLFEAVTIDRILGHFQSLLEMVVANPDGHIHALSIIPIAERHQILTEWNDTQTNHGRNSCFHCLFEAQAERTPNAVAVVFEDKQITYRELSRRVNQLAGQLKKIGVGPEDLVAVMARRDIDFLAIILAAFKVGGAYLPLHPSDPARRHHQVLSQSRAQFVLAADEYLDGITRLLESMPLEEHPLLISVETLMQPGHSTDDLIGCDLPRMLSYVIYTSGSTGTPKGAMIEHAGMLNHLYAKISDLQLTDSDVIAQTAFQTFDISVWQFLVALLVGGRVCIVNDETVKDPSDLLETVAREAVTILETVPSMLRTIVEIAPATATDRQDLSSLRWLLVTGEALAPGLCRQWMELYPGLGLVNAYGPTECSDDVTHHRIHLSPLMGVVHTHIGRPVCNLRTYVLDAMGLAVPITVAGELYVGGAGVGRGYLRDPGRTAESFRPDPFSGEHGARLYKTGDLVRYRTDGNIEFLGRIDHQVKIRGFRIELAEIEMVLTQHPALRQAVILLREDSPDHKRLTAYVIPSQESPPATDELRNYLKERLPDYMVPSVFVMIDTLPLTENGKLNRDALPAPDDSQLVDSEEFVEPDTPIEKKLAAIWRDVLQTERVGIYDNFFRLGGHSLMATQVIHRINQAFTVNLPVRSLFEEPTVVGLALVIEETMIERIEGELKLESVGEPEQ